MSEMIERVAQAICDAIAAQGDWAGMDLDTAARAAIEAMHEPTLAMLNRGVAAEEANLTYLEHYHEMISAALTACSAPPYPASSPPRAP